MSVAIVGLGLVSPLGPDRETSWQRLCDSAAVLPDGADAARGFSLPDDWLESGNSAARLERLALTTARAALQDAGLEHSPWLQSPRFGLVVSTSKGPLERYRRDEPATAASTPDSAPDVPVSRFEQLWPSGPSTCLIREFGLCGPAVCPVAACATGLECVLRGVRLIEQQDCDLVLAGSVDASLNDYLLASYRRLGVLADRQQVLTRAGRPFDLHRSGFVIGEGGALFVLASERWLQQWSGPAPQSYANWRSGHGLCDAAGLTQLETSGSSLSRLLAEVLQRSGLPATAIDLLHLHGTGTQANDLAEARAIRAVFGPPAQQPWSTASKGRHGHALGAAGSLELAWLLLSLRDGIIPPITNLAELDPDCPLRPVTGTTIRTPLQTGLKVSLGFGGHQVACIVSRGNRPAVVPAGSIGN